MDYVIGVDGGTTKTIALVADGRGHILGAARGGGSNWLGNEGLETPMGVVVATVQEALRQAGVLASEVAMAAMALAGADWPEDHTARQAFLAQAGIARQVVVKNDTFAGLRAGTSEPFGVVVAAGTGCNAAAIAPDGREWAFGYYEDDGGSGTIAWAAYKAVLRAEDGRGKPTRLTEVVLGRLGFPTPEALLRAHLAGQIDHGRFLSLCPLVFALADMGDEVAVEIIVREGLILAEYATALIRRFDMQALEFDVVCNGSVWKGQGPLLIDTFIQAVHRVAPRARIVRARFEPAIGGVLLAYDALHRPVSDEMYANLARTAPGPEFFSTFDGGHPPRRLRRE